MQAGQAPLNEDDATTDMTRGLKANPKYKYSYSEYWWTKAMQCFCFCFKGRDCYKNRVKRLKRHKIAEKQLAKETDFFKFIKLTRVSQFMSKIVLRKY